MHWSHDKHRAQKLEKENKILRKELQEARAKIEELEYELHRVAPVLTNDPDERYAPSFETPFYPGWYPRPRPSSRQAQGFFTRTPRTMAELDDAALLRLLGVDEEPGTLSSR